MWYLGSLFIILVFLSVCSTVGLAAAQLAPPRLRPFLAAGFAPLLGLACFVFLAVIVGWAGVGYHTWITLPLTAAAIAASVWSVGSARRVLAPMSTLLPFAFLTSFGPLLSVIRYGAYNPYNDTYTYLVQAQWLQSHPFRDAALISSAQPAWLQVAAYQAMKFRMGGSFLFGWLQSVFGVEWSYLVYPAAVLIPIIAGAYAIAAAARFIARGQRLVCLLGGGAVVTTFNGFSFGAVAGFLPQTYGLAFAFGALALLGMYVHAMGRTPGLPPSPWRLMPVSLLLAALLFSYPEIAPFVIAVIATHLTITGVRDRFRRRQMMRLSMVLAGSALVMANFELYRIISSLAIQKSAVVGSPVMWTPIQYLSHASGFLSGAWDGSFWLFRRPGVTIALAVACVGCTIAVLAGFRGRYPAAAVWPALLMILVSVLAFGYFRYAVASPWNQGVGQSWSQFKISNWVAPFLMFLIACAAALIARVSRMVRLLTVICLLAFQLAGTAWNYVLADARTRGIREETGFDRQPFDSFLHIRHLVLMNAHGSPVFLDLGGVHHKNRQMFTYFLADCKLASDWSDDGYIYPRLPENERVQSMHANMWVLAPADPIMPQMPEQRVGRLAFFRAPARHIGLASVTGGYGEETEGGSLWRWTANSLEYHHRVTGSLPVLLRAKCIYLPATRGRRLEIALLQKTEAKIDSLEMKNGWTAYMSPMFEITQPEFTLIFRCDRPAIALGSDPRRLSFLIKDLTLEIVR